MANLFDRLKETFLTSTERNVDESSTRSNIVERLSTVVTPENEVISKGSDDAVSAYSVNKQDGGKEMNASGKASSTDCNPDLAKSCRSDAQFVIPKRKKDESGILVDLMINSREYQHEILPAIVKSYRNSHSAKKFKYTKVHSVHNKDLLRLYLEKRKELRGNGYTDKEVGDCVAFLCVEKEDVMLRICRDGIAIGNYEKSCLGHPQMGVQLCKHADVLKPTKLVPNQSGYLILFKIIKGRIKSVAESMTDNPLEPTPHYDCHVSSLTNMEMSQLSPQGLFESSQVYMYEYGEEGVLQYPRNVCPVAVVSFVYKKDSRDPRSKTQRRDSLTSRVVMGQSGMTREEDAEFIVWSGNLTIKSLYACLVEMRSAAAFRKPAVLGKQINITYKLGVKQVQEKYLKNLTGIQRNSEGFWNGYYINACELHPVAPEGKSHFQRVMNYLGKHNAVAVQKLQKDVTLLMLTDSELTYQLGLSHPHQYPVLLYCLFLSRTSARDRLLSPLSVRKNTKTDNKEDYSREPVSFSNQHSHPVPSSPKMDLFKSPSSNLVSWPKSPHFGNVPKISPQNASLLSPSYGGSQSLSTQQASTPLPSRSSPHTMPQVGNAMHISTQSPFPIGYNTPRSEKSPQSEMTNPNFQGHNIPTNESSWGGIPPQSFVGQNVPNNEMPPFSERSRPLFTGQDVSNSEIGSHGGNPHLNQRRTSIESHSRIHQPSLSPRMPCSPSNQFGGPQPRFDSVGSNMNNLARPGFNSPQRPFPQPNFDQRFQNPVNPPRFTGPCRPPCDQNFGHPQFTDQSWNSAQNVQPQFNSPFRPQGPSSEFSVADTKFNTSPRAQNDMFHSPDKSPWHQKCQNNQIQCGGSPLPPSQGMCRLPSPFDPNACPSQSPNPNIATWKPSGPDHSPGYRSQNQNSNTSPFPTASHRMDPRLNKNISPIGPKVNPVAPMPRGNADVRGSPQYGLGQIVPQDYPIASVPRGNPNDMGGSPHQGLASPCQVVPHFNSFGQVVPNPGNSPAHVIPSQGIPNSGHAIPQEYHSPIQGSQPTHSSARPLQGTSPVQLPGPNSMCLPEPPRPSRVNKLLPVSEKAAAPVNIKHSDSYNDGFSCKAPVKSLMTHDCVKKEFEKQVKTIEIQIRAKEALKRHMMSKIRKENRAEDKKEHPTVEKIGTVKQETLKTDTSDIAESFEDMKQLLQSTLEHKIAEKKKSSSAKRKEKQKHKKTSKRKEVEITKSKPQKEKEKETLKLKIPESQTLKLDSLEDIARMRKITEDEIQKESERLENSDDEMDEEVLIDTSHKNGKKRPKERESIDDIKELDSESEEVVPKKAKIDTANDMKNFLNLSLEDGNSSLESTPARQDVQLKKKSFDVKKFGANKKKKREDKKKDDSGDKKKIQYYNLMDEIMLDEEPQKNTEECGKSIQDPSVESQDDSAKNDLKEADESDEKKLDGERSGRWDNPAKTRKVRSESESDAERKIENQKGKIIIIKEIRMIRVNSDGSEIKSPDKETIDKFETSRSISSPISHSSKDDFRPKEKHESMHYKDEKHSKKKDKKKQDRKNLVLYSDSDSDESKESQAKSRESSDDRHFKSIPAHYRHDKSGNYSKSKHDRSAEYHRKKHHKKHGKYRTKGHHKSSHGEERQYSKSKKRKGAITKLNNIQMKAKVKSMVQVKKDFKTQQAIIDGIITSANITLKKVPHFPKRTDKDTLKTTIPSSPTSPHCASLSGENRMQGLVCLADVSMTTNNENQGPMTSDQITSHSSPSSIASSTLDFSRVSPHTCSKDNSADQRLILCETDAEQNVIPCQSDVKQNVYKIELSSTHSVDTDIDKTVCATDVHGLAPICPHNTGAEFQVPDSDLASNPLKAREQLLCMKTDADTKKSICNEEKLTSTERSEDKNVPTPCSPTQTTSDIPRKTDMSSEFLFSTDVTTKQLHHSAAVINCSDDARKSGSSGQVKTYKRLVSKKMENDLKNVMNSFISSPKIQDSPKEATCSPQIGDIPRMAACLPSHETSPLEDNLVSLPLHDFCEMENKRTVDCIQDDAEPQLDKSGQLNHSKSKIVQDAKNVKNNDFTSTLNNNYVADILSQKDLDYHLRQTFPVFSEKVHPGLDKGIIHGFWKDENETDNEDEHELDIDRIIEDGETDYDLRMTIFNDTPVEQKFKWISKERLIRDSIHKINEIQLQELNPEDVILANSVNHILHRTIQTNIDERTVMTESLGVPEGKLPDGPNQINDTGEEHSNLQQISFDKDSQDKNLIPSFITEYNVDEKMHSQESKDNTSGSSLSSSQSSVRSFEKAMAEHLNSICQGLDVLIHSIDTNSNEEWNKFLVDDKLQHIQQAEDDALEKQFLQGHLGTQQYKDGKNREQNTPQEHCDDTKPSLGGITDDAHFKNKSNEHDEANGRSDNTSSIQHTGNIFWYKFMNLTQKSNKSLPSFSSDPDPKEINICSEQGVALTADQSGRNLDQVTTSAIKNESPHSLDSHVKEETVKCIDDCLSDNVKQCQSSLGHTQAENSSSRSSPEGKDNLNTEKVLKKGDVFMTSELYENVESLAKNQEKKYESQKFFDQIESNLTSSTKSFHSTTVQSTDKPAVEMASSTSVTKNREEFSDKRASNESVSQTEKKYTESSEDIVQLSTLGKGNEQDCLHLKQSNIKEATEMERESSGSFEKFRNQNKTKWDTDRMTDAVGEKDKVTNVADEKLPKKTILKESYLGFSEKEETNTISNSRNNAPIENPIIKEMPEKLPVTTHHQNYRKPSTKSGDKVIDAKDHDPNDACLKESCGRDILLDIIKNEDLAATATYPAKQDKSCTSARNENDVNNNAFENKVSTFNNSSLITSVPNTRTEIKMIDTGRKTNVTDELSKAFIPKEKVVKVTNNTGSAELQRSLPDVSSSALDGSSKSERNTKNVSHASSYCKSNTEKFGSDDYVAIKIKNDRKPTTPTKPSQKLNRLVNAPSSTTIPTENKSQSGPIRTKSGKEERQFHPYKKEKRHKRKNSWSFDIPYQSLQELMHDLTVSSYIRRHKPKTWLRSQHTRTNSRFANYKFVRSEVPVSLPERQEDTDEEEFNESAIPDFEERKRKADLVDLLTASGGQGQEFNTEQEVYLAGDAEEEKGEGKEIGERQKSVSKCLLNLPSRRPSSAGSGSIEAVSQNESSGYNKESSNSTTETEFREVHFTEKAVNKPSNLINKDKNTKINNSKHVVREELKANESATTQKKHSKCDTAKKQNNKLMEDASKHNQNPSKEKVSMEEQMNGSILHHKEASGDQKQGNLSSTVTSDDSRKNVKNFLPETDMTAACLSSPLKDKAIRTNAKSNDDSKQIDVESETECFKDWIVVDEADGDLSHSDSQDDTKISDHMMEKCDLGKNINESEKFTDNLKKLLPRKNSCNFLSDCDDSLCLNENKTSSLQRYEEGSVSTNWKNSGSLPETKEKMQVHKQKNEGSENLSAKLKIKFSHQDSEMDSKETDVMELQEEAENLNVEHKEGFSDNEINAKVLFSIPEVNQVLKKVNSNISSEKEKTSIEEEKGLKSVLSMHRMENEYALEKEETSVKGKFLKSDPSLDAVEGEISVQMTELMTEEQHALKKVLPVTNMENKISTSQCDASVNNKIPLEEKEISVKEKLYDNVSDRHQCSTSVSATNSTILESMDMSLSEVDENATETCEKNNNFIPIIYLSGVKGNPISWFGKKSPEDNASVEQRKEDILKSQSCVKEKSQSSDQKMQDDHYMHAKRETNQEPESTNLLMLNNHTVSVNESNSCESVQQKCKVDIHCECIVPSDKEKVSKNEVAKTSNDLNRHYEKLGKPLAKETFEQDSLSSQDMSTLNPLYPVVPRVNDNENTFNERTEHPMNKNNNYKELRMEDIPLPGEQRDVTHMLNSKTTSVVHSTLVKTSQEQQYSVDEKFSVEDGSEVKQNHSVCEKYSAQKKTELVNEKFEVENPRHADGSFETELQLQDIMSVISDSRNGLTEQYHSDDLQVCTQDCSNPENGCDLCIDQICFAKVKCLTDHLDPLEEAMLSSGILDVNDIPMGNVIEISTQESYLNSYDLHNICNFNQSSDCSEKLEEESAQVSNVKSYTVLRNVKLKENDATKQTLCYQPVNSTEEKNILEHSSAQENEDLDNTETASEGENEQSINLDYVSDSEKSDFESTFDGSDLSILIVSRSFSTNGTLSATFSQPISRNTETNGAANISTRSPILENTYKELQNQIIVSPSSKTEGSTYTMIKKDQRKIFSPCSTEINNKETEVSRVDVVRKDNNAAQAVRSLRPLASIQATPPSIPIQHVVAPYSMESYVKPALDKTLILHPVENLYSSMLYRFPLVQSLVLPERNQILHPSSRIPPYSSNQSCHIPFQTYASSQFQNEVPSIPLQYHMPQSVPFQQYPQFSPYFQQFQSMLFPTFTNFSFLQPTGPLLHQLPVEKTPAFELTNDRFEEFQQQRRQSKKHNAFFTDKANLSPQVTSYKPCNIILSSTSSFDLNKRKTDVHVSQVNPINMTLTLPPISTFTQREQCYLSSGKNEDNAGFQISKNASERHEMRPKQFDPSKNEQILPSRNVQLRPKFNQVKADSCTNIESKSLFSTKQHSVTTATSVPLNLVLQHDKSKEDATGKTTFKKKSKCNETGTVKKNKNCRSCKSVDSFNKKGSSIPVGHVRPIAKTKDSQQLQ